MGENSISDMEGSSNGSRSRKKQRKQEVEDDYCNEHNSIASTPSKKTTPLATHWYETNQLQRFNIKFVSEFPGHEGYKFFFENSQVELNDLSKELLTIDWNCEAPKLNTKTQESVLTDAFAFSCTLSESSVEKFVVSIMKLLDVDSRFEKKLTLFGPADMLESTCGYGLVNAVIENKCGGSFNVKNLKNYRCQLAAFMVAIALQNQETANCFGRQLKEQRLVGIIHYGLTPFFYKTIVSKDYVDAIQHLIDPSKQLATEGIPPLVITEYVPSKYPLNDRMIMYRSVREEILKSILAFDNLIKKYSNIHVEQLKASE